MLLEALDAGASDLDEIVGRSGVPAATALAALTILEFEGAVESRGASRYARVATLSGGEHAAR